MGIAFWLCGGLASFVLARLVPLRRGRGWLAELIAALFGAAICGLVATALDFGGWREPDWRAGVFSALGALTFAGALRTSRKNPLSEPVPSRNPGGSS